MKKLIILALIIITASSCGVPTAVSVPVPVFDSIVKKDTVKVDSLKVKTDTSHVKIK